MSDSLVIETHDLTKLFGSHTAVDGLTLRVERGEVFGMLGPNGAGKTTTMRMLTTLLAPSGGSARVCGFDVLEEPGEVRRHDGEEGRKPITVAREGLGKRMTGRTRLGADDEIDVRDLIAIADQRFTKEEIRCHCNLQRRLNHAKEPTARIVVGRAALAVGLRAEAVPLRNAGSSQGA